MSTRSRVAVGEPLVALMGVNGVVLMEKCKEIRQDGAGVEEGVADDSIDQNRAR